MRELVEKQSGFGAEAPGEEICATKSVKDFGSVSLYASVDNLPYLGPASFIRFNLYSTAANEYQHLASALCVPGTTGELIVVSGHMADSYHVKVQATNPRQTIKASLVARECCGKPAVQVRPDLLSLTFAPPETGLGELLWTPMTPWGLTTGAPGLLSTVGGAAGDVGPFPPGARLTHWVAQGSAAATLRFDGLATGVPFNIPSTAQSQGYPNGQLITNVHFTNLAYGEFEFVV